MQPYIRDTVSNALDMHSLMRSLRTSNSRSLVLWRSGGGGDVGMHIPMDDGDVGMHIPMDDEPLLEARIAGARLGWSRRHCGDTATSLQVRPYGDMHIRMRAPLALRISVCTRRWPYAYPNAAAAVRGRRR